MAASNLQPRPFPSQQACLDAARVMFQARRERCEAERAKKSDPSRIDATREADRDATRRWHRCVRLAAASIPFARLCADKGLSGIEREILMVLVLERLAVLDRRFDNCADVVAYLGYTAKHALAAMRALSEEGRLFRERLIDHEDDDEDLRDRVVRPDPLVVDAFLHGSQRTSDAWDVEDENALLDRLSTLTVSIRALANAHDSERRGFGSRHTSRRALRRVQVLLDGLRLTLARHQDWKLNALFSPQHGFDREQRIVLLALLGKECGHLPRSDSLFTGQWLAQAASVSANHVRQTNSLLMSSGLLQREGLIQPDGSEESVLTDDERTVEEAEFELASNGLELFGLDERSFKSGRGKFAPRKPVVRLEQLILPAPVFEAVRMALAHARHARTLLDAWGFAEVLPYGRTIAILLSGPPGVGKTACAEAIADELHRPILAVDYSVVQNCYLGQTEKNIVRIFRDARIANAVLFWDEADAMFYDRGSAQHAWEAREVNVLLQELERFDGVCILATNRKISLDAALSRRIAIKIELERPNRELRRQIWDKLLPRKMPLAADVDLERLSKADFVGGEIKNVIVNAARRALLRGERSRVTMSDFEEAVRQEHANRWGGEGCRRLGFGQGSN
jgi:hypothetical protein